MSWCAQDLELSRTGQVSSRLGCAGYCTRLWICEVKRVGLPGELCVPSHSPSLHLLPVTLPISTPQIQ